jgi:O-antigen ligase
LPRAAGLSETVAPAILGVAAGAAVCTASPAAWAGAAAAAIAAPLCWYAFRAGQGWVPLFLAAALLLPPLPFAWGDSGPHLAPLFALAGALGSLTRIRQWRFRISFLNLALLFLVGALILSVGFAAMYSGLTIALGSATRVGLFGIAVLVYFSAWPRRAGRAQRAATRLLFCIALIAALFGCLDFVFQLPAPAGYGAQFIWLDSGVYRRAQGLFYEASTLGNFCAFFLIMIAAALSQPNSERPLPPAFLWTGGIVFAIALAASFSRASLIAVLIGLAALAIVERRRWLRPRTALAIGGGAVLAALLIAFALPEFAQGYWARIVFSIDNAVARPDRVLSGRLDNWSALAAFVREHPWRTLLGIGYKTLPYTTYLGKPLIADNMYLSALVETGVAGLSALIALNVAILRAAWKAIGGRNAFYAKWIFCFWTGEIVQMFSGDIFTYWRVLPVFFWALAQALAEGDDANPGG